MNMASFEQLIRPHLDRLYRVAFRLTGTVNDAEDLVQDVLVKLYARGSELEDIERLSPWLARVAYNQFVDNRRRYGGAYVHLVSTDTAGNVEYQAPPVLESELPGPEQAFDIDLEITRVQAAIGQLSESHRVAVMLHDVEGYSLQEIESITETPIGTLKSRLHRARARLKVLLQVEPSASKLRVTQ